MKISSAKIKSSAIASVLQQAILHFRDSNLEPAGILCSKILQEQPDNFDALYLQGVITLQQGDAQNAAELLAKALDLKPDHAGTCAAFGDALAGMKRYEEALHRYQRALHIKPDFAEVHNNMGTVLEDIYRYEEALVCYESALQIRPDFAEAHNNKGNIYRALQRFGEALACYDRAIQIQPDYAEALNNRANSLMVLRRNEEAISAFARLLQVRPDYDYALGNMFYEQLQCCDWTHYRETSERIIRLNNESKRASLPFSFLAYSLVPAEQLKCAAIYISDRYPAVSTARRVDVRPRQDRIRLAYVSADFREHAMAYLLAGLFENHSKDHFETIAISFSPEDVSQTGQRVKAAFGTFIDASSMNDDEVIDLIENLEVDIAVDLLGFTQAHRTALFSRRPAPIQVNYLGYPGTMGAGFYDYILADRHVIPPEDRHCYSENVVYLPDTYQVNDSKRYIVEQTPTREDLKLPDTGFVFCCFNSNYKIAPDIFDIWMRLLNKVPGSVLWLMGCSATVRLNLKREAAARGVETGRLVFAPHMKHAEHLARQRVADLFLDTLPYNAHTTASDALWAGLPVLTCTGTTFSGRVASSLLHAVGLSELITHNLEEYENLALKLATKPALLADIRAKLLRNRSKYPLFDTARFCYHIESAYVTMWERYQRGESPADFSVRLKENTAEV
jgi:predicted O-linked N-acetylglucosamine transferase (SPINDLY family)